MTYDMFNWLIRLSTDIITLFTARFPAEWHAEVVVLVAVVEEVASNSTKVDGV